jgi:hypothetical protein
MLKSGASGRAQKKGGPGSPFEEDSDKTPENETQVERKRRLNRINERKKRARKVAKIETLTSQYHRLIADNSKLKEENKAIREKIEQIKQMTPTRDTRGSTGRGSTFPIQPPSRAQLRMDLPTLSATTSATTRSSTPPSSASNLASEISSFSREQRIQLLQNELEKQQFIIQQLRLLRDGSGQTQHMPSSTAAAQSLARPGTGIANQDAQWLSLSRTLQNNSTATQNSLSTALLLGAEPPNPRINTAMGMSQTLGGSSSSNNNNSRSPLEDVLERIGSLPLDNPFVQQLLQAALRQMAENNAPNNNNYFGNTNTNHQGMR